MKSTISALALGILLLTGCASTPPAATPTSSGFVNDNPAPPIPSTASPTPTPTQTTPAAPAGHAVGEVVKVDQGGGNTAQVTIVSASYVSELGNSAYSRTPGKGGFLVLDVLWETTSGTTSPNPFYFNMRDAAAHSGALAPGTGDDLNSDPIPAGDKIAGKVAQDIGAGPWRVTLSVGSQPVYWTIPAA